MPRIFQYRPIFCGFFALIALSMFAQADQQVEKELDFMVLGVITSTKDQEGVALIKSKSKGNVFAVKEGAMVDKTYRIFKVETEQVTFTEKDQMFIVEVGSDVPRNSTKSTTAGSSTLAINSGIERIGSEVRVTSALKDKLVNENLQEVLMQAAVEPYLEEGMIVGFKIWEIDKGSIYEKVGLNDGDLITHINGHQLNDVGSAITTLKGLKNSSEVDIIFKNSRGEDQQVKIVVD